MYLNRLSRERRKGIFLEQATPALVLALLLNMHQCSNVCGHRAIVREDSHVWEIEE